MSPAIVHANKVVNNITIGRPMRALYLGMHCGLATSRHCAPYTEDIGHLMHAVLLFLCILSKQTHRYCS